jgi:hypothetical protein
VERVPVQLDGDPAVDEREVDRGAPAVAESQREVRFHSGDPC